MGTLFVGGYLVWFFGNDHQGYAPFYWPLTLASLFLICRLLAEWYYYYRISFPKTIPGNEAAPTVDIFTTFCPGEPKEMVIRTLEAIQHITYPHTTYLCDEANDEELKRYCRETGIHHSTRNTRVDAKAGNINNALARANGELCLIIDPDHIPARAFLDNLIPYFQDPHIGFVQSVQAYYNQEESYIAKGAAQQTYLFYGPLMLGMNGLGTVPAIGANCFFRRSALDSIGGHANGLAEDMHTSLKLHALGWKSVFHPEILSRGLAPSTLSAYLQQQLKWSKGTWDIILSAFLQQFKRLQWNHRLHYAGAALFYLLGFVYLINFIIPILSLTTSRFPWKVDFSEFLFFVIPILTQTFIIRHYVQRWVFEETERGFHAVGGILFISSWWIYCLGIFYAIFRINVPYLPTPKQHQSHTDFRLHLPNIIIVVVSVFAIVYGLRTDWNHFSLFMAGFALTNVVVLLVGMSFGTPFTFEQDSFMTWLSQQLIIPFKEFLWQLRHEVYLLVRQYALPLSIMIVLGIVVFSPISSPQQNSTLRKTGLQPFLTGVSLTAFANIKPSDLAEMLIIAQKADIQSATFIDSLTVLIATANKSQKIPYFSWAFPAGEFPDSTLYSSIVHGQFDEQLEAMKQAILMSEQPLFLHPLIPTPDPGIQPGQAIPLTSQYLQAWQYVHHWFQEENSENSSGCGSFRIHP